MSTPSAREHDDDDADSIRVVMLCTGVGVMNRGIESFFRECFDALHGAEGFDITLLKGGGSDAPGEQRVWCLPRTGLAARGLAFLARRNGYVIEQLTALPGVTRHIRAIMPHIVFYSDVNLAMRLARWRERHGLRFKLVYSNGAPLNPPFRNVDHVHQVAPHNLQHALDTGEPPNKHTLIPYGIRVPSGDPIVDPARKTALRRELGLPLDRPILLSVGWIAAEHKRMDYLVREVASLPKTHPGAGAGARPFVVMLGAMDHHSPPVLALARQLLGADGFAARSVPYEQVGSYYQAADAFALCSLREGFGRVYLESLIHGLPTLAHDHPVMRYVLGDQGVLRDLSKPGGLTGALTAALAESPTHALAAQRRNYVRQHFGWDALQPQYLDMFRRIARNTNANA